MVQGVLISCLRLVWALIEGRQLCCRFIRLCTDTFYITRKHRNRCSNLSSGFADRSQQRVIILCGSSHGGWVGREKISKGLSELVRKGRCVGARRLER